MIATGINAPMPCVLNRKKRSVATIRRPCGQADPIQAKRRPRRTAPPNLYDLYVLVAKLDAVFTRTDIRCWMNGDPERRRFTDREQPIMNIISSFLCIEDVVVELNVPDKQRALEEAASMVERRKSMHRALIFRALWRREQIGSTGLGHGVAIPHARIAGISEPIVLLMRTKFPIAFGAPDHKPVSVLCVILVPEHANDEHLQILATVSEMFSHKDFRDRLKAARDPAAIQRLFSDG